MAKVCLLLLLLAGLSMPGYTQNNDKVIAVLGSSTAAGFGLPTSYGTMQNTWDYQNDDDPPNSWANRLRTYYQNLHILDALHNYAVGGKAVNVAMPDGDQALNITVAMFANPDVVIVNFPSNGYDTMSVASAMYYFRTIYATATANGTTTCYICTTQPRTSDHWSDDPVQNEGQDWLANRLRLKTIKDSIIAEFPNNYIDFYTPALDAAAPSGSSNYLGIKAEYAQVEDNGDGTTSLSGTHLNEDGHLLLFNQVLAKNILPIGSLPLKVGSLHVKRIDDTHITVTFTILDGNTEKEFFIWVKDKAGNTKSVRVVIPDKTKTSQTVTETIQIY